MACVIDRSLATVGLDWDADSQMRGAEVCTEGGVELSPLVMSLGCVGGAGYRDGTLGVWSGRRASGWRWAWVTWRLGGVAAGLAGP